MKIEARRSPDKRLRTGVYTGKEGESFSIAEETASGTLITEFKANGEILNQLFNSNNDALSALSEYLGETAELDITDTNVYERVKVNAECPKCGSDKIERTLDRQETKKISNIPVVPLFVCDKCGSKFYSMSDSYLRRLISSKESLFEPDEAAERSKNESEFVHTMQEYIIRIFASKKIQKLTIKG
jgi:predicted RNA-binding Zn-ribbon protein involved in translation (DUF1610 family)